jgi:DNA-binding CsgD family transcriptional regulator
MALWLQGDYQRAAALERESIEFKILFDDLLGIAVAMEVLAWIAADSNNPTRAATLLGALHTLWQTTGLSLLHYMRDFHEKCEQKTRQMLDDAAYANAFDKGSSFSRQQAIRYATPRPAVAFPERVAEPTPLTSRQTQVAELIANGLTNRHIANRLAISQRTTEAHVEEILARLGFTSRAQIAAWITNHQHHP